MDEPRAVSHPFWLFKLFTPSHSEQVYRRRVTTQLFKPPLRLKEPFASRSSKDPFGWKIALARRRSVHRHTGRRRHRRRVLCLLLPKPGICAPSSLSTCTDRRRRLWRRRRARVPILVPRRILSAAYFNLACAFFLLLYTDIFSPLSAKCP